MKHLMELLSTVFSCAIQLVYFKIALRQPQLIVRNYIFGMKNKSDRKTYWSCVSDRKTFCRAALTTHGQEIWIRENHNHDPPLICLDGLKCRKFNVKQQKAQGSYNYNYYFRRNLVSLLYKSSYSELVKFIHCGTRSNFGQVLWRGFVYTLHNYVPRLGRSYWTCQFKRQKCRGKIVTYENKIRFLREEHNHPPPDTLDYNLLYSSHFHLDIL
ncbi:hypothetical protein HUJ05_001585 [Dendroctonus ponderosae]|nr:hypothetical protein HUJ05_001585 [Dendroctonus ponderosae]